MNEIGVQEKCTGANMDDMVMKSVLSVNNTLEPIMRVVFSKSGTHKLQTN